MMTATRPVRCIETIDAARMVGKRSTRPVSEVRTRGVESTVRVAATLMEAAMERVAPARLTEPTGMKRKMLEPIEMPACISGKMKPPGGEKTAREKCDRSRAEETRR